MSTLYKNSFIGEMSFLTLKESTLKVGANGEDNYLYWEKFDLVHLMNENPEIELGITAIINRDMILKIKYY